uniref:Phosphoglycerate mutase n=3 Tax=Meloidogyne incognita group TaxID=654580 RepID=A0A915MXF7_MELJA
MPRVLWVVRHAEREDNINSNWRKTANPHKLKSDNSPLSSRGHQQAKELAARFANVHIDHIFASPFERTVETATAIASEIKIPIKLEPGLCEALYMCEEPPSFEEPEALKKRFHLIDTSYKPIFNKPMPKEGMGDSACVGRLQKTIEGICEKFKDAKSIVLVSHASPIGAIHEVLVNKWTYVGQATVTKFVETEKGSKETKFWSKQKQFCLEYSANADHLSNKSNLRPY